MAYLLQLYCEENSLKCRLRNKLLIDDIHITITEGRGWVRNEGKKAIDLGGWMYCSKLFDLVQLWNILADVELPTSRAQLFSQVRSARGRLLSPAVKASERARVLLVSLAKKIESSDIILARISCFPDECVVACVSSRAMKVCQNKQITGKNSNERQ